LPNAFRKRYNMRMSTVAEQLHQAREAKKLTIEQVAEITKIRTDHLRALEEGNFDVFSAPVYVRGFVRTLATLLKLDVPQTMASLDAELRQFKKFSEPPSLSGPPRGVLDFIMLQLSKVDWRKVFIGLCILVALAGSAWGFARWRERKRKDTTHNLPPGKVQGPGDLALPLHSPPQKR
jgi:cytoskeletal protein RodZ